MEVRYVQGASLMTQWLKKKSTCQCRRPGLIPGSGSSPGEGNGNLLQYSCWEIPWTEEPGGLQSIGSQGIGHDLLTKQ